MTMLMLREVHASAYLIVDSRSSFNLLDSFAFVLGSDSIFFTGLEQFSVSITGKGTTTLALPSSGVGSRHASSGEVRYLRALVDKHGEDVGAMARDMKLNAEQRTEGQLRRALKKAGLQ